MRTELDRIAENNYAREEGRKQGLAEGTAKGRAEGKAEGKAETIRAMAASFKEQGVEIAIISRATGLSIEEIQAL